MAGDAFVELNLRTTEMKEKMRKAIFAATREVFSIDIEQAAKEGSPVSTGTNKRSIATDVEETPDGVKAELYTQSGYGGYLELGTRRMSARPYLYPAFEQNVNKIPDVAKGKLNQ